MATRKPRLMLTKRYKSTAAAKKASQSWATKLGVSVGAMGPAGRKSTKSASKKTKRRNPKGPARGRGGRFVKRGRR